MKAIVNERYGSPDILELREVERPTPKPNQVLVKVLAGGLFKPKFQILGADIAGIVEGVGSNVTQLKKGDEVYGDLSGTGFGGFAEYVAADEKLFAKKPSTLTFEETAALPMAAVTALQGLRDIGKIKAGQDVLINGASGGVGGFAMQIAKALGAKVTAVCSTRKVDNALAQGADEVIDYTVQDFTKGQKQYDLIFDVVGNHAINDLSRVLKNKGTYVSSAFSMGVVFLGPWKSITEGKKMTNFLAKAKQADLQFICKLAEEGKLKPVIEKTFALEDLPKAMRKIANGSSSGKLLITI